MTCVYPPSVAIVSEWTDVDTWPLKHGDCYHVTKVDGPYGLWDSSWRLSFIITRSLWNYSRYIFQMCRLVTSSTWNYNTLPCNKRAGKMTNYWGTPSLYRRLQRREIRTLQCLIRHHGQDKCRIEVWRSRSVSIRWRRKGINTAVPNRSAGLWQSAFIPNKCYNSEFLIIYRNTKKNMSLKLLYLLVWLQTHMY